MTMAKRIQIGIHLLAAGLLALAVTATERAPASAAGTVAILDTSDKAFGRPLPNLPPERFPEMIEGRLVFVHPFTADGPRGLTGLGPLYVADSCAACHFKDGRGRRPRDPAEPHPPMIFRLGAHGAPSLGGQLQDRGLGVRPEGRVQITYREEPGSYADGSTYSLRRPEYRLLDTAPRDETDLPALAPRIPPTLVGIGLLEAVESAQVLELADPADADGDGISGRPSWVAGSDRRLLGRFGWKARQATLEDQVTAALAEDMGIDATSEPPEISPHHLRQLVLYLRLLAPPARRDVDRLAVRLGERLFAEAGCAGCHRPQLRTAPVEVLTGPSELASQSIHPYTDLLLHDMGPELADDGEDGRPEGREWRTPPLWGLGLLEQVNGETYLLHDGRARSFEEAILWHGGEAAASRRRFTNLAVSDREALLAFLASL